MNKLIEMLPKKSIFFSGWFKFQRKQLQTTFLYDILMKCGIVIRMLFWGDVLNETTKNN